VVTNQSAIGRGLLSESRLAEIHQRMFELFAAEGATFTGAYHCPVMPLVADRTTMEHVDRKPGPGLLLRAARELCLDLHRSWMVGDSTSDVLAGRNAGCGGSILVATGEGASAADRERFKFPGFHEAKDLPAAADLIAAST
jgi:D-glycero-D-manno-heptose 1,7-bisphosphate phosphatase